MSIDSKGHLAKDIAALVKNYRELKVSIVDFDTSLSLVTIKIKDLTFKIEVPANYPNSAPKIVIVEPYYKQIDTSDCTSDKLIYSYIKDYINSDKDSKKYLAKEIAELVRNYRELEVSIADVKYTSDTEVKIKIGDLLIKIELPANYPKIAPTIWIYKPYYKQIDFSDWKSDKLLYSYIRDYINNYIESLSLYLVLGGYPFVGESIGRSFYKNQSVYILDIADKKETDLFQDRYIKCDFTDVDDLKTLANAYPKRFKTILFDWSSYKYFEDDNEKERLELLLSLLTPNGTLVIEQPHTGWSTPSNEAQVKRMRSLCSVATNLGYHIELNNSSIVTDSILKEAYKRNNNEITILALVTKNILSLGNNLCTKTDEQILSTIAYLKVMRGGGRRKQTRKRSRKSKGTRRH